MKIRNILISSAILLSVSATSMAASPTCKDIVATWKGTGQFLNLATNKKDNNAKVTVAIKSDTDNAYDFSITIDDGSGAPDSLGPFSGNCQVQNGQPQMHISRYFNRNQILGYNFILTGSNNAHANGYDFLGKLYSSELNKVSH
ncbi:MAG: hypothetical protein K0U29_01950 [Gammaproteobacteria bacterium]|nr:hypothetical protein [Gammaproteobacteria bacterium]MCH9743672.1 hypothetical protein [Gammaproteobacteria bacterium]